MLGLFRLLRLAALRELRGGWLLMLAAASLLIIAAGLVALPLVFRAASADLALQEADRAVAAGCDLRRSCSGVSTGGGGGF